MLLNTLLVIAFCALSAYGLQRFLRAHPISPLTIWVRGLQGGLVGVGASVILGAFLAVLARPAPESQFYFFTLMVVGLGVMGLPIGVMSGIVLHFRTVPKA